jgi:hypothetical protein
MGEIINMHTPLVGKAEERRSFGRPRGIWEDTIKLNLREIACEGMGWIEPTQERIDKLF